MRSFENTVRRLEAELRQRDAAIERLDAFVSERTIAEPQTPESLQLRGKVLLYVGGRTHSAPRLNKIAERFGATVLHHDGGQQQAIALLPGLVVRAEMVFFPVDCVSHDGAVTVKRLCKQADKLYIPLRSAGLGAFLQALADVKTRIL